MNQSIILTIDSIELELSQEPVKRDIITAQKTLQLMELQSQLKVLEEELAQKQAKRKSV